MRKKYGLWFTKAVASGNDFIIIDNKSGELDIKDIDYADMARELCPRHTAVGADGILVLEDADDADFRMRIINPDGSEVAMCGNGARCSALYASVNGWGNNLDFVTGAGMLHADVDGEKVRIKMSDPRDLKMDVNLGLGNVMINAHYVDTGVPHVVHLVEDLQGYPVVEIGRKIREHTLFAPNGTNADFVGGLEKGEFHIRTYERGVEDETLACGTGTVAGAVILGLLGRAESPVDIRTKSGEMLTVYFKICGDKVSEVFLEGSAALVYEGRV